MYLAVWKARANIYLQEQTNKKNLMKLPVYQESEIGHRRSFCHDYNNKHFKIASLWTKDMHVRTLKQLFAHVHLANQSWDESIRAHRWQ